MIIPLSLSAYIHIWNPIGFPSLFYDEGVYLGRAMHVALGQGPQETSGYYDHPYFGQLFLAGALKLIGYPHLAKCCTSGLASGISQLHSIESLYISPRVLMGFLAIVDTFLIYKISERLYRDRNIAFIASILFALMPITWLLRWILLDNIQLPLILSSLLFALYVKDFSEDKNCSSNKMIPTIFVSGLFLGLAIFTKIPAFAVIPMVGSLLYRSHHRKIKITALWLVPVIFIPMIWPAYSIAFGKFNDWSKTVVAQTQRPHRPLFNAIELALVVDPVLVAGGACGMVFAAARRDYLLLLWAGPYLLFLFLIGWVIVFHLILILPPLCIAASVMMVQLPKKVANSKKMHKLNKQLLTYAIVSVIGIFGLISSVMLVTKNVSLSQFEAAAFVSEYIRNNYNENHEISIVSNPIYSWIFRYAFDLNNVYPDYRGPLFHPIQTQKFLLIADPHFMANMRSPEGLQLIYNSTTTIATFKGEVDKLDNHKYPYTSMDLNYEGGNVEIRIGKQQISSSR